jgi:hypothetical protein
MAPVVEVDEGGVTAVLLLWVDAFPPFVAQVIVFCESLNSYSVGFSSFCSM